MPLGVSLLTIQLVGYSPINSPSREKVNIRHLFIPYHKRMTKLFVGLRRESMYVFWVLVLELKILKFVLSSIIVCYTFTEAYCKSRFPYTSNFMVVPFQGLEFYRFLILPGQ